MTTVANPTQGSQHSSTSEPRGRFVAWIWIGLAVSAPFHGILLAVLSSIHVGVGGTTGTSIQTIEIALVDAEPLSPSTGSTSSGSESTPEVRAAETDFGGAEFMIAGLPDPTGNSQGDAAVVAEGAEGLFASGGGGGSGGIGNGMGGGTTFFGVGGRGRRIGYVIDKSGSMGIDDRMLQAKVELVRSIVSLPDYASVCVALFDDDFITLDKEGGFIKCRDESVGRLKGWIMDVGQGGGTNPVSAFQFVLSRPERPDVVFFMSDGEIPPDAADEILRMNRRGPNTVIHCIAFGQAAATAPLRRIAAETGGTFSVSASRSSP